MKNRNGILAFVAVVALASVALAQTAPTIGVYFDDQGTSTSLISDLGVANLQTGYVLVGNANLQLAGAAFRLDNPDNVTILPATYTPGVVFGDLLNGVEIGFYTPIAVFGSDFGQVCSFPFYSDNTILGGHLNITNHPDYATPVISDLNSVLYDATGLSASVSFRVPGDIGVFFDTAATQQTAVFNGDPSGVIVNAYVMARGAEMLVSGAAFKLDMDTGLINPVIVNYTPGTQFGDLFTGLEIAFYTTEPVFGTTPGLIASMVLMTGTTTFTDQALTIVAHPNYDTPILADDSGALWPANGLTSFMTVPVATENMTWGQVKSLY